MLKLFKILPFLLTLGLIACDKETIVGDPVVEGALTEERNGARTETAAAVARADAAEIAAAEAARLQAAAEERAKALEARAVAAETKATEAEQIAADLRAAAGAGAVEVATAKAAQRAAELARDQAIAARDAATTARDAAIAARDAAVVARTAAETARDTAVTQRNAATAARDAAVTARDEAVADRDAARRNSRQLYVMNCQSCHANNGRGGGIEAQNLTTCDNADPGRCTNLNTLRSYIEANMPQGNPGACVGNCATLTAAFVLSNFRGGVTGQAVAPPVGAGEPRVLIAGDARFHELDAQNRVVGPNSLLPGFFRVYDASTPDSLRWSMENTNAVRTGIGRAVVVTDIPGFRHIELRSPDGTTTLGRMFAGPRTGIVTFEPAFAASRGFGANSYVAVDLTTASDGGKMPRSGVYSFMGQRLQKGPGVVPVAQGASLTIADGVSLSADAGSIAGNAWAGANVGDNQTVTIQQLGPVEDVSRVHNADDTLTGVLFEDSSGFVGQFCPAVGQPCIQYFGNIP